MLYNASSGIRALNTLAAAGRPLFFLIDFEKTRWFVCPEDELGRWKLWYSFGPNDPQKNTRTQVLQPPAYADYKRAFDKVRSEQFLGNSYVCNLTGATRIALPGGLSALRDAAQAKFLLHVQDARIWPTPFVVASPEEFLFSTGNVLSTRPMKGTRKWHANGGPPALTVLQDLLGDTKEEDEHRTVVDLLRNDLGIIGKKVSVPEWRYPEFIPNAEGGLWTTSSRVDAELAPGWQAKLGQLLDAVLPAGSISGAPKLETLRIIRQAENEARGFYTGVAGHFDGSTLRSWVLIRFVEEPEPGKFYFRSGGGITTRSSAASEYLELIEKAAVPTWAGRSLGGDSLRVGSEFSPALQQRLGGGAAAKLLGEGQPVFVETICLDAGWSPLMAEHSLRFSRTMASYRRLRGMGEAPENHLPRLILEALEQNAWALAFPGQLRCRVLYSDRVHSVEFSEYAPATFRRAVLVAADRLEYSAKLVDRSELLAAAAGLAADEYPIFVRDGLVSDGVSGNVVLEREGRFLTPAAPLLRGTRRAWLLEACRLEEARISVEDVLAAGSVGIINAFWDLGQWVLPVRQ